MGAVAEFADFVEEPAVFGVPEEVGGEKLASFVAVFDDGAEEVDLGCVTSSDSVAFDFAIEFEGDLVVSFEALVAEGEKLDGGFVGEGRGRGLGFEGEDCEEEREGDGGVVV